MFAILQRMVKLRLAFVFCNFGHSEKAETIITKIKKKMVNGGKVYGGYWTKETCA